MEGMKTRTTAFVLGIASIATLALVSGCIVDPDGRVVYRAGVVVDAPPPVVVVDEVPDDYYWDGFEYVGLVGGAYFYLGPGNVWMRCEPWRVDRFHVWERDHTDWREHAVRNDRYRNDSHGHYQPRHDARGDRDRRDDRGR